MEEKKINQKILKLCLEKGLLLDKEVFDTLEKIDDEELIGEVIEGISQSSEKIITKSFLTNNINQLRNFVSDEKVVDKLRINLGLSIEISKEKFVKKKKLVGPKIEVGVEEKDEEINVDNNLRVLSSVVNLTKKLKASDFTKYFKTRYSELRNILQERKELETAISINKISGQRQNLSIIGIVFEKRITKNKNILIQVEDITGRIAVLVNQNKPEIYDVAKEILLDDVIGIRGVGSREIVFANEIFYPDASLSEKIKINRDEIVAFISDIHFGSTNFLEENFLKFIDWINGKSKDENQRKEALKIKYLLINGDSVDGVGVYPGQEELLTIKDIRKQYEGLAELLGKIRKDVKIIICPGQHDAVRVAEPQPFIRKDFAVALYELDNIVFVSNPAMVEIANGSSRGVKILMYHGASMHYFVSEIDSLRYNKAHDTPSLIVKQMLKRRHLSPTHSATTYIPTENQDHLIIREIPDIITTADLHRPEVDSYNNILIVCSSCWQSITPFEEKVGNNPDPCKVPILNLKTRQVKILDFSD